MHRGHTRDPDFELLEQEIEPFQVGNRTISAALLAWFLETVWRIEPEAVVDSICDGSGDKGIDGIVVDEELSEIAVFQCKHRDHPTATQGDADLRAFKGVDVYFRDPSSIDNLLRSGPNAELRNLIARLEIRDRLEEGFHLTRLVFVTNAPLDIAGADYVRSAEDDDLPLEAWDRGRLAPVAAAILAYLKQWTPAPEGSPQSIARLAGDLVDDAQAVEALERNQLGYARLAQRARMLSIALARLRDGSYGRCDQCGQPIPPARLRAIPGVATCVPCQEEVERLAGPARRP